ncbi:hypothetical protein HDV03_004975 [Kappamyces sp. JEL0829]|nr:hypothetical protein HDV03_004975 [Kappamyces sp. JEL0829]
MDTTDYMTHLFLQHKDEYPHMTQQKLGQFLEKFNATIPCRVTVENARDLRKIRHLFYKLHRQSLTQEDNVFMDLFFPANLGPFSNKVCSDRLRLIQQLRSAASLSSDPAEAHTEVIGDSTVQEAVIAAAAE